MSYEEIVVKYKENLLPDIPFTEIKGEHFGTALYRYEMKWGQYEMKRIVYMPYGNPLPPSWSINGRGLLRFQTGNFEEWLEEKWNTETFGKIIPTPDIY